MVPVTHVRRFDHIGITVADLDSATAFFVALGLEVEGTGSEVELAQFLAPDHVPITGSTPG